MLSSSLEKFKWKKDNLATCRCPFCGDSKKNKYKTRGFFYQQDSNYVFKCHNCGVPHSIYTVLETVSPALCKDYTFENFKDKSGEDQTYSKPLVLPVDAFLGLRLDMLSENHKAVQYLVSRKIPKDKYSLFYYTNDFGKIMESFGRTGIKEERLVIPSYNDAGELIGVQGRALDKNPLRYITLKREGEDRLWFNLNNINPRETVYVVEGPIDSVFIPNCVAMQCAGWIDELPAKIRKSNVVFVFDNEPRNLEIVKIIGKYVAKGRKVVIWPNDLPEKDINEMVEAHGEHATMNMLINRVFHGLGAILEFTKWRQIYE